MAGHSKWANIKHQKAKSDAKKGKAFTRVTKEIITAVKLGGSDPRSNPRLRMAIQKAREANLPNDNIDRNIKKAAGADQGDIFELTYEIFGPGGVGIIVETVTDNKNRTATDLSIAATGKKRGGNVARPGSVTHNFDRQGLIQIARDSITEEALLELVLDAGATDLEVEEEVYIVVTEPSGLYAVKDVIDNKGLRCLESGFDWIPKVSVPYNEEVFKANKAIIDFLEELDDVNTVYHNMELPEDEE